MPKLARFCSFWFASGYIDGPGCWQSARKLPGADLGGFGPCAKKLGKTRPDTSVLGGYRFRVYRVIEPLRTRCAPREGAGRPSVDGRKNTEHPPRPRETRNSGGVYGAVLVLCAMSSPRDAKSQKSTFVASYTRPTNVQRYQSRFQLSNAHIIPFQLGRSAEL